MNELKIVGVMDSAYEINNRVYSPNGICPTVTTCTGGQRAKSDSKKIRSKKMNEIITVCELNFDVWSKRYKETRRVLSPNGICQTITAGGAEALNLK